MTKKEWEEIQTAAELLGLGEKASLAEIKRAYRNLSKRYHPDVHKDAKQPPAKDSMHKLSEAYQVLLKYCAEYRFPLFPGEDEPLEGEDWWFERFGQDHHWGKGTVAKKETKE